MNKFYYLHIAPIICRIVGHKWSGEAGYLTKETRLRRFSYSRKGGKRRAQIYRKYQKHKVKYCSRCGLIMTKAERRKQK